MDLFEKNRTEALKGFFSFIVLISHLCSRTGLGGEVGLGPIYTGIAYLCVSFFFFISGFGISFSYYQTGQRYLCGFLAHRVVPFYCLNLLLVVLYAVAKFILLPDSFQWRVVGLSLLWGGTIVTNGWFLQVLVLLYLLFFFSFRFSGNKGGICVLMGCIAYVLIARVLHMSSTWYESVLAFPVGVLVAKEVNKISFISRWTLLLASISCSFVFVLCFVFGNGPFLGNEKVILKMISAALFPLLTLSFASFFHFERNRIVKWLQSHYLEIYLLQGLAFVLLSNRFWSVGRIGFFVGGIFLTFLMAMLFKPAIISFITGVRSFLLKNRMK